MSILNKLLKEYEAEKVNALSELYLLVINRLAKGKLKTKDCLIALFFMQLENDEYLLEHSAGKLEAIFSDIYFHVFDEDFFADENFTSKLLLLKDQY